MFKMYDARNNRFRISKRMTDRRTFEELKRSMRKIRKKNPRVSHVTSICPTFENPSAKQRAERGRGRWRGAGGFSKARM